MSEHSKEDMAAAEVAGLAEREAHERRIYSYSADYLPEAIARRFFLQGIAHGKREKEKECARLREALEKITTRQVSWVPTRGGGYYTHESADIARKALAPKQEENGGEG